MVPADAWGLLFEIKYISIEHRWADPMINSIPQTRYKLHFFFPFTILPHLTSPEALESENYDCVVEMFAQLERGPLTSHVPILSQWHPSPTLHPPATKCNMCLVIFLFIILLSSVSTRLDWITAGSVVYLWFFSHAEPLMNGQFSQSFQTVTSVRQPLNYSLTFSSFYCSYINWL